MININNILTQLNAKMAADIADSYNIPELVKRVEAYQKLNVDAGTVPEYSSYNELPDSDSANIGQIVYVKQKPGSRGDFDNDTKDSAGTFFFGKKVGTNIIGWQKIPLLAGDSDYADISAPVPPPFQGSISGYLSAGEPSSAPGNRIDKWSFTSDGNATDVGDLINAYSSYSGGHSSSSDGYVSGGYYSYNHIQKFPFSSDTNASDIGDLTLGRTVVGHSSSESGYSSGGNRSPLSPSQSDIIDKFPFSVDANATDVGDLLTTKWNNAGISSSSDGYNAGGENPSVTNVIEKFSFSVDGNSTDVGDLTVARNLPTGTNSDTHGYATGSTNPYNGAGNNTIDKFPFASDANATDVGDIPTARGTGSTGQSSTASGYMAGGFGAPPSPNYKNQIEKFSFSSDGNATDVGDLTAGRFGGAGQQV